MRKCTTFAMAIALTAASHTVADIFTLDFEGLGDRDNILNFYNGGTSDQGFSGINYGVEFLVSAESIIDKDAGGSGHFENEPSPSTILYSPGDLSLVMNVAAGFDTGVTLYYGNGVSLNGVLEIFDNLNATGNLLATIQLPRNNFDGFIDEWTFVGLGFEGIALSVRLQGSRGNIGYDDLTFGMVPTPGALILLAMSPFVVNRRRRR